MSYLAPIPCRFVGTPQRGVSTLKCHHLQRELAVEPYIQEEHMKIPFVGKKGATSKDPVCHVNVDVDAPPGGAWEHDGVTYYFCGPGCNRAFQKGPQAYLSGDKKLDM